LWSAPLGGASTSSPSVVDGTVYVGANDGKLYAFDEDSGALEWSTPGLGGAVTSSAAVANGVVYVTVQSKKKLFAIDAGTGVKLRSIATKANPSSAIVANGDVYVSGTTGLQAYGLAPAKATSRPDPRSLVPDPRLG
jgi:outer membrane protein assembly factor BamB